VNRFFWICLAGAVGTGARYLLSNAIARVSGDGFPFGTLAVNLIGSFLIGLIMHIGLSSEQLSATLRLTLTTGLMGGFTTFSAFSYETLRLYERGAWGMGALNVVGSVAACLIACWLGSAAARAFL
jgi:CrcB protein